MTGFSERPAHWPDSVTDDDIAAYVRRRIESRPLLSSYHAVLDFLHMESGHLAKEEMRVMFLDRKNVLIACEVMARGTVDHVPVYIREIMARALELNASAIILSHNHPAGDPTPSQADLVLTGQIEECGAFLGIVLHDHIIIGAGKEHSMRMAGEIQKRGKRK